MNWKHDYNFELVQGKEQEEPGIQDIIFYWEVSSLRSLYSLPKFQKKFKHLIISCFISTM